jgi:hypothetical protein
MSFLRLEKSRISKAYRCSPVNMNDKDNVVRKGLIPAFMRLTLTKNLQG